MSGIDNVQVHITDLGENGEGIGRHEGMAVFVPGALPGETVSIQIIRQKKNYAQGRLVSILQASPNRMVPPCSVARLCGGCQIQEMAYAAQIAWKEAHVRACLDRIAKLPEVPVLPILGMDAPWHYRNKVLYPIGGTSQAPEPGFYQRGTHQVVSAKGCMIHPGINGEILKAAGELMARHGIQPYSEATRTGHIRHILLRNSQQGEWMMVWITSGLAMPNAQQVAEALKARFPQIGTMLVNRNPHGDHRTLGARTDILYGTGVLEDTIGALTFRISPESFFQVNPIQTRVLYDQALDLAALRGHETVLDLYCGIGTITLSLAQAAARVIGVEVVREAIADAQANAKINGIDNVEFIHGTAEAVLPQLVKQGIRPDVVVVDPPRKGCGPGALQALLAIAPERIIYISCKPATLARDLRILTDGGYRLQRVQPVDMFPHSVHVEVVSVLFKS